VIIRKTRKNFYHKFLIFKNCSHLFFRGIVVTQEKDGKTLVTTPIKNREENKITFFNLSTGLFKRS
jgi:hypothetical protein